MGDDNLRLVASVTDEFTGPLSRLRKGVQEVSEETKKHAGAIAKDWDTARGGVEKFRGVLTGLSPVLSAVGMGGLGAAISLGGVVAAVRGMAATTRDLSLFAREVGVTVNELRSVQALGENFGVSADRMKSAMGTFATNMDQMRRRTGELYRDMQGMGLGALAEKMIDAPTVIEAFKRAVEGIAEIQNPQRRRELAEKVFALPEMSAVAAELRGHVRETFKTMSDQIGEVSKEQEEAAKSYEQSLARIGRAFEKYKIEFLGPLMKGVARGLELDPNDPNSLLKDKRESRAEADRYAKAAPEGSWKRRFYENNRDGLDAEIRKLEDATRKGTRDGIRDAAREQPNGGATVQNQSYSGPEAGGGLIHKASFGGFPGFGGPMGGYGPGRGPLGGNGAGYGGSGGGQRGAGGDRAPVLDAPAPRGSDAGNLTRLIEREARAAGIDPRIMQGIRAGESGHRQNGSNPRRAYDHNPGTAAIPEDSWGPFQLNRRRGLGQQFQRETGLDLSDPRTIPAQTRWVARYLAKQIRRNPNYSPFPTWQGFHGRRDANPRWGDSGYVPRENAPAPAEAQQAPAAPADGGVQRNADQPVSLRRGPPAGVDGQRGVDLGNGLIRMRDGSIRSRTYGAPRQAAGTLHIKVDGPPGVQVRHDVADLFDDVKVSTARQMGA